MVAGVTGVLSWGDLTEGQQDKLESNLSSSPTSSKKTPEPPAKTSNIITEIFPIITVNRRGEEIDRRQGSAQVFQEDLGNGVILEMVKIPAGSFMMGSLPDEVGKIDDQGPQHQVNVREFWLGKYVVTQAQYQQIMGNNPAYFKGKKRPIERVSWDMSQQFCQKLSELTGKKYRLPSEAEREYAGRAGTTTPFHFGETLTDKLANYEASYAYADGPKGVISQETTDVGSFPSNAFGLYDIHGNVWEWCEDTWHDNYNNAPNDGSAWISSDNTDNNIWRMLRGGSWYDYPTYCRVAFRGNNNRAYVSYTIGFRVSCDLV